MRPRTGLSPIAVVRSQNPLGAMSTIFRIAVCATLCLGLRNAEVGAQTYYVAVDGTGDGSSWAEASGDLREVLSRAQAGESVWVARGLYRPSTCTTCTETDRARAFVVPNGVQVYGGFAGDENSLDVRNPAAYPSTLSGEIDADAELTGNSYHVVRIAGADARTRLDGFTVTRGYADGSRDDTDGPALFVDGRDAPSAPTIANCTFSGNVAEGAGGAVHHAGSTGGEVTATYVNCTFVDNVAEEGGAVYMDGEGGSATPEFYGCTFENNTARNGGAVYNRAVEGIASPSFSGCTFRGNATTTGYGGAVYNFAKSVGGVSSPLFANCIFASNSGIGAGGAMYTLSSTDGTAEPTIVGGVLYDNYSRIGGAVYVNSSGGPAVLTIANTIIEANRAGFDRFLHFSGNTDPQIVFDHVQIDTSSCDAVTAGTGGTLTCLDGMIYDRPAGFADAPRGNFVLVPSAAGIGTASAVAYESRGIEEDFFGAARVQGSPDLGPFESGSGPLSPVADVTAAAFSAYPNPVGDYLHLSTSSPATRVTLIDPAGRIALTDVPGAPTTELTLATAPLRPGLYFLEVLTVDGARRSRRILIQRP